MDVNKAKELIAYHSCHHSDFNHAKWQNGFLGQLRPYRGKLHEENFLELVEGLKGLKPLFEGDTVNKVIVAMLFDVCTLPRLWAFHPTGMLRKNNLISKQELARLDDWLIKLSEGVSYLLAGSPEEVENILIAYGEPLED